MNMHKERKACLQLVGPRANKITTKRCGSSVSQDARRSHLPSPTASLHLPPVTRSLWTSQLKRSSNEQELQNAAVIIWISAIDGGAEGALIQSGAEGVATYMKQVCGWSNAVRY